MTLNQILYFRKVARLENYHQAAEELYISQPSLSRSMAALESELGITLFEKKGRGVVLTNAGRLFLRTHPGTPGIPGYLPVCFRPEHAPRQRYER